MKGLKLKIMAFLLGCLTMTACVDYDDIQPFNGKTLPRKSGYSTGVTNDWIYFNLRTGEMFNAYGVNKDIKEGEQYGRTDWDLAFCGYVLRTNSGTSGIGRGGAADLGYGEYNKWTSVSQLPSDLEWVVDNGEVSVTMSQNDWNHYLVENGLDFDSNPWFDPNNGRTTGTITWWRTGWILILIPGSTRTTDRKGQRPMPIRCWPRR